MTTILKCKMCGGTLEIQENETVARCKYCGSLMTLPKIDSDKKARIFNRANEYRLNNDFDKAYDAYKAIVEEDPTEAEAYWGMILSEYGIEYVEDPKTGTRIPTCHRTQTTPVVNNPNFQMALKYADSERRMMYQDEAETLDKLQRSILSVSTKEEPYDVFISYKETDDVTGERTEDSVIAQDIYNELKRAGIRTFFSRITLADHLGENYEPYIYAALQSSKILLTVSTTPEHLESTWVKNEWMRFLRMKDKEPSKMIIPVYKNMSPYDLPSVLSAFQSQDMSKIGAVQELVQGVERILNRKEISERDLILNQIIEREKDFNKQKAPASNRNKIILGISIALLVIVGVFVFTRSRPGLTGSNQINSEDIELLQNGNGVTIDCDFSNRKVISGGYRYGCTVTNNNDFSFSNGSGYIVLYDTNGNVIDTKENNPGMPSGVSRFSIGVGKPITSGESAGAYLEINTYQDFADYKYCFTSINEDYDDDIEHSYDHQAISHVLDQWVTSDK